MLTKIGIAVLLSLTVLITVPSCSEEEKEQPEEVSRDNEEAARLKQEIEVLKGQLAQRDSSLNETVGLINEIQSNLTSIASSQGRIKKVQVENQEDPKQFIMGEIEAINAMRETNQRKVAQLNKELEKSGLQNTELQKLVESLTTQIAAQEVEIEALKSELEKLDAEYTELFETYVETAELAEDRQNELNTAWYAYGTTKELKENGVITKQGGFIGLGKIEKLRQDFNKDYFQQIDITQTRKVEVAASKVRLLTTHPAGSYELKVDGNKTVVDITDPKSFWSVSKYLVVIVD